MNIQNKFERNALLTRAEAILDQADSERRGLTPDEQSEYDEATTRVKQINAATPAFPTGRVTDSAPDPMGAAQAAMSREVKPFGASNFDAPRISAPYSGVRLTAFRNDRQGRADAYASGQWAAATLLRHGPSMAWCQHHGVTVDVFAALGEGGSAGSLVPNQLSAAIIELRDTHGLFRRVANVQPMSSDLLTIPRRVGGLTSYFVGENTAGTESDATWDNISLSAKKLMVLSRMSSEVSEDAIIKLADKLAEEIGLSFALKEDQCGFLGTGTSTYGGITGVLTKATDGSHALASIEAAATHDLFSEIDADDLLALMAGVPLYAKQGSAWFCSPTAKALVFDAIKMAGGGTTSTMLAELQADSFLGYPIYVTPVMNDVTTSLDTLPMIAFGNLGMAATLGSRSEIRVALSGERYFELDQVGIRGTERFDIVAHDLGSATVKSPFVVLVGNIA